MLFQGWKLSEHVREQLSEEELTVFDLLTRPGPDLSPEERDEVKKVARRLLERVRAALVLDWRQRAQAWAQVKLAIEDTPRPSGRGARNSRLPIHLMQTNH